MKKLFILLLCLSLCVPCAFSLAGEAERETFASGDFEYALLDDGTAEITRYGGSAETLEVPEALDGHAVTAIGDSAFSGYRSLTSITIPDSVTAIGDSAFSWCFGLTSITIPDSVTALGECAFSDCANLISITIPDSVTAIGEDAFKNCDGLTITVGRDSFAMQYCIDNDLPYTYPDANDWLND